MRIYNEPFTSAADEIDAWMSFVDRLCRLMVIKTGSEDDALPHRVGHKPDEAHIAEALLDAGEGDDPFSPELWKQFGDLLELGAESSEGIAHAVWRVFRSPAFDDYERLAFIIALSTDINRKYERIYDYLSGDSSGSGRPTIGLVLDMYRLVFPDDGRDHTRLLNDDSLFRRLFTERRSHTGSMMGEELKIRKSVIMLLLGQEDEIGRAAGAITYLSGADTDERIIHPDIYEDLRRIHSGREQALIHLNAGRGAGKRYLMNSLAKDNAPGVICINLSILLGMKEDAVRNLLEETALKHLLFNDTVYLDAGDLAQTDMYKLRQVTDFLRQYVYQIYIGGDGRLPDDLASDRLRFVFPIAAPDRSAQKILWEDLAARYGVIYADDVDLDELVSKFNITPGNIERTIKCCAALHAGTGEASDAAAPAVISRDAIEGQLRSLSGEKLGSLAKKLTASFGLGDIQLRDDTRTTVDQVLNRIRHRSTVNDTYGFSVKLPYGRGVSVVLYGPPGTGKTMLACVIAHELGLDLYRVDTSEIGSKYIGETEKNLSALFDAARGSNGILFFDEADALFAKRTDVESSNDKHANSEVAFLLQQIEEYDGLSILATNAVHNFDAAFKRRMTYMISVDRPDEEERLLLWQHVFPEATPLAKDVNFGLYARVDGMTGSSIKAAAVTAAYFAAAENRAVTNADIIEAIDAEYRKAGNMSGIKQDLLSGVL